MNNLHIYIYTYMVEHEFIEWLPWTLSCQKTTETETSL